jgi:sugar O-acyltransferase (sialic acid O-acetyltransferase NeuD family)
MKTIAVVGAGGHGKVVAELAELCGYDVAFFDDNYPNMKFNEHWKIVGTLNDLLSKKNECRNVVIAVGNNNFRTKLFKQLSIKEFELPVLVHPSAVVSKYANVNSGTVVFANVVINAFAQIGHNCIVNTGTVVEHDCILGDGVHLSPNVALAGGTIVGDTSWLGIGTVTKQLIKIGANSIIGANSTVTRNIPSNVTAFGSPAVIIKN